MLNKNEPVLELKEVVECEVHEESKVKLNVKYCEPFSKRLGVINVTHVVAPPD